MATPLQARAGAEDRAVERLVEVLETHLQKGVTEYKDKTGRAQVVAADPEQWRSWIDPSDATMESVQKIGYVIPPGGRTIDRTASGGSGGGRVQVIRTPIECMVMFRAPLATPIAGVVRRQYMRILASCYRDAMTYAIDGYSRKDGVIDGVELTSDFRGVDDLTPDKDGEQLVGIASVTFEIIQKVQTTRIIRS